MYDSVIRQAENDIRMQVCIFLEYGISGFLWRHNFINVRQIKSM